MNKTKLGIAMMVLITFSLASIPAFAESVSVSQDVTPDQVLIYAFPYQIGEFSVWTGNSYATAQWNQAIHAGLYSRQSSLNRLFGPHLAAAMPTVSDDGLNWTVDLKSGLLFENGNPITADDVVFSYKVALTPGININTYSTFAQWFSSNDSIVKIDDDTVQFNLADTYAFTLGLLSSAIIDESVYSARYDDCIAGDLDACDWNAESGADNAGSAGPYKVDSIDTTNNIVTVTKNFNYVNQEDVWADTMIFQFIETKEAALSELTAGNVDLIDYNYVPLPEDFVGLTGVEFTSISSPQHQEISLNHLNPFYGTGEDIPGNGGTADAASAEDARLVRNAMSHIINRQFLVDEILDGLAQPASTVMPSASIGWDSSLTPDSYDILGARALMEQAGFDYTGVLDVGDVDDACDSNCLFEITVLSPNTNPARNQWAALYVTELPKIGIGVKEHVSTGWDIIIPRTFGYANNTLVPDYEGGGFDIFFVGYSWALDFNPSGLYTNSGLCDAGSCGNFYNYINATVENQIFDYLSDVNVTSRNEKVRDLQAMLFHERPVLPLVYAQVTWAWAGDVLGLDLLLAASSSQEWGDVRKAAWLEPAKPPAEEPEPTSEPTTSEPSPLDVSYILLGVITTSFIALYMRRRR